MEVIQGGAGNEGGNDGNNPSKDSQTVIDALKSQLALEHTEYSKLYDKYLEEIVNLQGEKGRADHLKDLTIRFKTLSIVLPAALISVGLLLGLGYKSYRDNEVKALNSFHFKNSKSDIDESEARLKRQRVQYRTLITTLGYEFPDHCYELKVQPKSNSNPLEIFCSNSGTYGYRTIGHKKGFGLTLQKIHAFYDGSIAYTEEFDFNGNLWRTIEDSDRDGKSEVYLESDNVLKLPICSEAHNLDRLLHIKSKDTPCYEPRPHKDKPKLAPK